MEVEASLSKMFQQKWEGKEMEGRCVIDDATVRNFANSNHHNACWSKMHYPKSSLFFQFSFPYFYWRRSRRVMFHAPFFFVSHKCMQIYAHGFTLVFKVAAKS